MIGVKFPGLIFLFIYLFFGQITLYNKARIDNYIAKVNYFKVHVLSRFLMKTN